MSTTVVIMNAVLGYRRRPDPALPLTADAGAGDDHHHAGQTPGLVRGD